MNAFSDAIVVHDLLRRGGDVVTYADADAAGVPRAVVRRCAAQGDVIRVGKAAFVATERWQSASAWERFRLASIGFAMSAGPDVFLTGHAAALVHAIPVDGSPPTVPTAVRPGNPHTGLSRSAHGRVRSGYLPLAHQQQRHRVGVVSPAYTVVDIARHGTPVAGLMAADHVLHRGLHRDIPAALVRYMHAYPGIEKARWVLRHADSRCESPLETLGRYIFIRAGRPVPLSNVWIYGPGKPRRVDHLFPEHGVVIEADGAVKYNNRADAAEIVEDEKERHRWLERAGLSVIRYTNAIARNRPSEFLADLDRTIRERRGRPVPTCWSLEPPNSVTG